MLAVVCSTANAQAPGASTASAIRPQQAEAPTFDENASTKELLESAREMFLAKNYSVAEMLYKSVLVREPKNVSAMLELSVVYEVTGKLDHAQALLTRAATVNPNNREIIDRTGEIAGKMSSSLEAEIQTLLADGKYDLVIPKLSVLLTAQPKNAELHYLKADCHLKLGRPEAAIVEIDRALHLTRDERFYTLREQAQTVIQERKVNALVRRAKLELESTGEATKDGAFRIIGQILDIDPDNSWAKRTFVALGGDKLTTDKTLWNDEWPGMTWEGIKKAAGQIGPRSAMLLRALNERAEILISIVMLLLILNSPLTFMLIKGFSPRHPLSGQLQQFSMQEILSLLHNHEHTGVLKIRTQGPRARVYFNTGEIYHCQAGKLGGRDALHEILKNEKEGFFVFEEGTLSRSRTVDVPLSLILMDLPGRKHAYTTQDTLRRQRATQGHQSRMKQLLDNQKS